MDITSSLPDIFSPEFIVTVVVIFITIVCLIIWSRNRAVRRSILLVGLSDSGKSLIYSRLVHNTFVHTYTSTAENKGEFVSTVGRLQIIDVPGHERLRNKYFDQYKSMAKGIVFVIDSVTFPKDIRDVAEYLYNILSDPVVTSNCPSFMILCNKQDQTMAKGSKVVQNLLEKEMNTLRITKSNQLDTLNESGNRPTFLGKKGRRFEFSHMNPIKICFAEAAALNIDVELPAELDYLQQWLMYIC